MKFQPYAFIDAHTKTHFFGSAFLVAVFSIFTLVEIAWLLSIFLGFLWEVKDGFAPHWTWYIPPRNYPTTLYGKAKLWFVKNCMYADGFGWFDLVVDIAGATAMLFLLAMIRDFV